MMTVDFMTSVVSTVYVMMQCVIFIFANLLFGYIIAALQKFSAQVERYPSDTQYDLVASYCRASTDCADIIQLLESSNKPSNSATSVQNSEKINKSEKVRLCLCEFCKN